MKMKRLIALILALTMVFALAACGGKDDGTTGNGGTTGTNAPTGDVTYSVTVQDVLGTPYTENIIVVFKQDGEPVAMQPVNAEGKVVKTMSAGTYDIELQITNNADGYYYVSEGLQVTATSAELVITLSNVVGKDIEVLNVYGLERSLYKLVVTPASEGATEGTFVLEDVKGDLDGTYNYKLNSEGGYDVTNAAGEDVGMSIILNLDDTFAFQCEGMSFAQNMVQEGEATATLTGTYSVESNEYIAHPISAGCTYVELDTTERNFVIFTPVRSGIYEITVHNATAEIGYYGSPFFVATHSSAEEVGEQAIRIEIKDSMIGTGDTGTAQMVLGIDAAEGNENCIISIVRVGDAVLTDDEKPWTVYHGTHRPTKYTLPEGLTLQDFDLTASYEIVYNEADGYYHVGSPDGAIVLVRMDGTLSYGGSFGIMLSAMNVGAFFYDEEGTFLRKELYNDCLLSYLGTLNKGMGTYTYSDGMLDDTHNVYPLTQDLMYIIQTYGDYTGWWDASSGNYLFGSLPGVNVESAWLFMCCYAQA